MNLYTLMREFADSWALLVLFALFIVVAVWAFRPGARRVHDDIAQIPFRYEDKPLPEMQGESGGQGGLK